MRTPYDRWLTTDRKAEQGDRVVAYDFGGNPVTENQLPHYYLVNGELVRKDSKEMPEDFLQLGESELQEVLEHFYNINNNPTVHDLKGERE